MITLRAILVAIPAPSGPQWTTHLAKSTKTGIARSTVCSAPPRMATRPFSAALSPGVTPQSSSSTPAWAQVSASSWTTGTATVDSSTTTKPGCAPESTPCSPESTVLAWSASTTATMTTSLARATSAGDASGAGTPARWSAASGRMS